MSELKQIFQDYLNDFDYLTTLQKSIVDKKYLNSKISFTSVVTDVSSLRINCQSSIQTMRKKERFGEFESEYYYFYFDISINGETNIALAQINRGDIIEVYGTIIAIEKSHRSTGSTFILYISISAISVKKVYHNSFTAKTIGLSTRIDPFEEVVKDEQRRSDDDAKKYTIIYAVIFTLIGIGLFTYGNYHLNSWNHLFCYLVIAIGSLLGLIGVGLFISLGRFS